MHGVPWYDDHITAMIAAQLATKQGHVAIAAHWRTVAEHLTQIAAQHEALAAALPDAVQASADLATMAAAHHQTNVATVLSGEQELNQRRDDQVTRLDARMTRIEAKLDQLIAGRCAACESSSGPPPPQSTSTHT